MVTTTFSAALLTSLAKTLVDKGIAVASSKTNKILKSLANKEISTEYYNKAINKVFVFRTLTHGDKNVYLDEIYYPLNITHSTKGGITIEDEVELENDATCIIGLAGQGKTTIMRKLFLEELVRRRSIPFFITLRQINDFNNLQVDTLLLEHLNNNGIICTIDDVNELCKKKLVTIYFDGFDEIPPQQRKSALKLLEGAHSKFNCRTIITSRPDTEITREPGYEIYNVDFLEENDIFEILNHKIKNREAKKQLTNILEDKEFLIESIKTPILLDIFIVTSASIKDDPSSISDYYDGLFTALIYRHDLIKNLNRKKKSTLSDKELEIIFSLFSFLSLMNNKSDFSKRELIDLFEKCLKIRQLEELPALIMEDILDGTNIIVRDGYDNFVYIHKSIQEYFSAKCISTMDDISKEHTLKKLAELNNKTWSESNTNLLLMLSYLDSFNFVKYFIFPVLIKEKLLEDKECKALEKKSLEKCIDNWIVGVSIKELTCRYINPTPPGELVGKIIAIDSINRILDGGDLNSLMDEATTTILFYDAEKVAEIAIEHVNFNIQDIPSSVTSGFSKHFKNTYKDDIKLFKLNSIKDHYNNYDILTEKLYEDCKKSIDSINNYIKKNYKEKIMSDTILNDILKSISFENK